MGAAAVDYSKMHYTIEEYLAMENESPEKHEYYQGEIFMMAGAALPHNMIADNLHFHLRSRMIGKNCRPFTSDTRIYIPQNTLFTYPDISVVCGEIETLNNDNFNVLNPSVIIEVLSAGTRGYDKREKFQLYRAIPTLKEYILVDSTAVLIEAFFFNANRHWELTDYRVSDGALKLHTLGIEVGMKDIYEGTNLIK